MCPVSACSSGSRKKQPPMEGENPAALGQPGSAAESPSVRDSVSEGEPLFALYDELSLTFARHTDDCAKMRDESALVIERHKPAIQAWGAAMVMLPPNEATEAATRLRARGGARMDAFELAMKQAQTKCSKEMTPLLHGVSGLSGQPSR
jgi:hypothetical protein